MSTSTLLFTSMLFLLLLLSPLETSMVCRQTSSPRVVEATRPLVTKFPEYVILNPARSNHHHHKKHGYRGREVESCMPKGFRRSSAPSRYGNFHTLGSTACGSSKRQHSYNEP
ncbi:hypothetical protein BVC80_1731g59 [Macleaya cordata]|uniref:Rapid ALkalinization Factor n=1 Tax=Macleaya cordata TaxID=56857 RepID=A0A200Q952_MACCD|nr:hypothetical protein BVC80_1731g59 [Macleaya cordata]